MCGDAPRIERLPPVASTAPFDEFSALDAAGDFEFVEQSSWDHVIGSPNTAEKWLEYQTPMLLDGVALRHAIRPDISYEVHGIARGYFADDLRIEFTGQESSFGVEAGIAGGVKHQVGPWEMTLHGEFYLNQRFERNLLAIDQHRVSYLGNFAVDPFEISQLNLSVRRNDLLFSLGKMVTPFGRTYFPIYRNNRQDAPFIRTESIIWRETGFLIQYDPGAWVFTAAIFNGAEDRDNNSSKAFVGRIGRETEHAAVGASIKWQDGLGSEFQKLYNNHLGLDAMVRRGRFRLSGEVIYDQYGFRQPFDPLNITWGRSVYNREQHVSFFDPITGMGYYVNLDIDHQRWTGTVNYGEFYPTTKTGDPIHDVTTRRALAKLIYRLTPNYQFFASLLLENDVKVAQLGRLRKGITVHGGFQFGL